MGLDTGSRFAVRDSTIRRFDDSTIRRFDDSTIRRLRDYGFPMPDQGCPIRD